MHVAITHFFNYRVFLLILRFEKNLIPAMSIAIIHVIGVSTSEICVTLVVRIQIITIYTSVCILLRLLYQIFRIFFGTFFEMCTFFQLVESDFGREMHLFAWIIISSPGQYLVGIRVRIGFANNIILRQFILLNGFLPHQNSLLGFYIRLVEECVN